MVTYANITRLYNGHASLYGAVQGLGKVTVNRRFGCGGENGTWLDDPLSEAPQHVAPQPQAVADLCSGGERGGLLSLPHLFNLVKETIAEAWRPDAFHLVFASSGYDSRIIAKAIRMLYLEHGDSWLGQGLLFLSNRWEAQPFIEIMKLIGWDSNYWAVYDENSLDEHFRRGLDSVWRCAPCAIPGNLWHYLPEWAEECGRLPAPENTQAFTGLWANEAWNVFLRTPNVWLQYVESWYGRNQMASLPVRARWVEYPLVSLEVLRYLHNLCDTVSGDVLRKNLADYAAHEVLHIPRLPLDDRKHPLSESLRKELGGRYQATWFGKQVGWLIPTTSEFSTEWGRYSVAMLIEQLRAQGVEVR